MGRCFNQDFGWRIGVFGLVALALVIVPAACYAGRIDRIPLPKPSAEQLGNLSAGAAVATAFSSAAFVAMT